MDKRDVALQLQLPVIPVPRFSKYVRETRPGDQLLVASNGIFLEVRRAWSTIVRKISDICVPVPYGAMEESTQLHCGTVPKDLLLQFAISAQEHSSVEIGASIVWNQFSNQFSLVPSNIISTTAHSLKYERPALNPGDHLVVDCHSHAHHAAGFSTTDNADDMHEVKFSYVVGNCNKAVTSQAMRICVRGIFNEIPLPPLAMKGNSL